MNNNGSVIVTLPLRKGWKKAERVVEDVAPTKFPTGATTKRQQHFPHSDCDSGSSSTLTQQSALSENASSGSEQQLRDSDICLVCSENKARYTCPRCQIPYCSIECYRNHTNATDTESESITNKTNSHSCTEIFFKRKVTSIMKLESLEQEEEAHRALNRYHHKNFSQHDFQEPLEGSNSEIENLYELKSQLEILENNNTELSHNELAKLLPPSLKAMFEKDLQTGQLQPEWVLNRWYPWWKPELLWNGKEGKGEGERDESSFDTNNENRRDNSSTFSKTLDERLLRVPNYESFGGTKSTLATVKNKNDDVLVCNLLDILYAICRTLRLYHGVENASRQEPVEAALTLISTSAVLGKDTRFTTISQVLNHHCNCTTETLTSSSSSNNSKNKIESNNALGNANISDDPANWDVCIEDITSLVTSPRMVGRALLEASDILKAAIKALKFDQSNTQIKKKESKSDDDDTKLKQIRRLRKKIQFFLSWARHSVAVNLLSGGGPKEEVLAWIDERKQMFLDYQCDEDNNSSITIVDDSLHRVNTNTMKALTLHPSGSISTTKSSRSNSAYVGRDSNSISEAKMEQPLLIEVQSRRKK